MNLKAEFILHNLLIKVPCVKFYAHFGKLGIDTRFAHKIGR
jgi:hypothetical protein